MEGRQYRGYYRGATKQVNQAVEAIHRAAERANATVTELVSTREPTSFFPNTYKTRPPGVPVAFWCSFYRLFNAAWIRSKERSLPRICMTVYRSGEFSFPVRARRRKPETSATVPG